MGSRIRGRIFRLWRKDHVCRQGKLKRENSKIPENGGRRG